MVNQDNYFDLWDIFFNELVGDVLLGIIGGLLIIWLVAAKAKLPNEVSLLLGMLWLMIVFAHTQILTIWTFIGLIISGMFYYKLSKFIKR